MTAPTGKPFQLTGADDKPIEVPAGEYYFNTKARCRRMMLNSLSSDARRVYACLELATMGFQQELAVVMERGKQRPLTPADVKAQSGLLKQNVTRGFVELEEEGLAERRADDGGALRNGHIQLYSWAFPRATKKSKGNRARLPFPAWFPKSWEPFRPLINRFKLSLIDDEVIARDYYEEGEQVARDYQKAEEVAARFLDKVRAAPVSSRIRERTERTLERKAESSGLAGLPLLEEAVPVPDQPASQPPAPAPPPEPEPAPAPESPERIHGVLLDLAVRDIALSAANIAELRAIVQPAGPDFEAIFAREINAAQKKRQGEPLNRGLVLHIAREAADAAAHVPRAREPAPAAVESPEQRRQWIEIAWAAYHAAIEDEEKQQAREQLEQLDAWTDGGAG